MLRLKLKISLSLSLRSLSLIHSRPFVSTNESDDLKNKLRWSSTFWLLPTARAFLSSKRDLFW